ARARGHSPSRHRGSRSRCCPAVRSGRSWAAAYTAGALVRRSTKERRFARTISRDDPPSTVTLGLRRRRRGSLHLLGGWVRTFGRGRGSRIVALLVLAALVASLCFAIVVRALT